MLGCVNVMGVEVCKCEGCLMREKDVCRDMVLCLK